MFSGVKNFFQGIFGDSEEEKRRKRQQAQQAQQQKQQQQPVVKPPQVKNVLQPNQVQQPPKVAQVKNMFNNGNVPDPTKPTVITQLKEVKAQPTDPTKPSNASKVTNFVRKEITAPFERQGARAVKLDQPASTPQQRQQAVSAATDEQAAARRVALTKGRNIGAQAQLDVQKMARAGKSEQEIKSFIDKAEKANKKAQTQNKGDTAQILSWFMGAGGAAKGAAQAGAKRLSGLADDVAAGVTGAVGYQASNNPESKAEDYLKAAGVGGAGGAAGYGVARGLSRLFRRGNPAESVEKGAAKAAVDEAADVASRERPVTPVRRSETPTRTPNPRQTIKEATTQIEQLTAQKQTVQQEAEQLARNLKDSQLPIEEKTARVQAAQAEYQKTMKELDDNIAQSQEQVAAANQQVADGAKQVTDAAKATQADQAAAQAVPEGATPAPVQANTEVNLNDAYRTQQDERQTELSQNKVRALFEKVRREVYDPRSVQQSLSDRLFKADVKAGLTKPGQREATSSRDLAYIRGRIENPASASVVRDKQKVTVGNVTASLDDIIKKYGTDNSPKARQFENYRIFKDELERIDRGAKPSLGLDPDQMRAAVINYEQAVNPDAIADNAVLREISLQGLAEKRAARIDAPELYDNSAAFEFYNPRAALNPEDLNKPRVTGGVRSGAKMTQNRSENAGGEVRSPLSLFKQNHVDLERALAEQEYGNLIKELADRGITYAGKGFNEVVNAETAIAHRQSMNELRDLAEQIAEAKAGRGAVQKEKSKVAGMIRNGGTKAKALENEAVDRTRQFLLDIAGRKDKVGTNLDEGTINARAESAYNRYFKANTTEDGMPIDQTKTLEQVDREAREVALQVSEQLQPTVGSNQAFGDVAPYAATMKPQDLMQVFDAINNYDGSKLAALGAKIEKQNAKNAGAQADFERLAGELEDARNKVNGLKDARADNYQNFVDTVQNKERGTQTVQYRLDGETGEVEIPIQLANELDAANRARDISPIERAAGAVANVQKLAWTGVLSPVFKTLQVMKNIPLAYRNGEGLSGVGINALASVAGQVFNTPATREFRKEMLARGASYENALQTRNIQRSVADDVAERSGVVEFFARNPVRTIGDVWKGLDKALSFVDNAQRQAVAYGATQRAVRMGFSPEDALDIGARAGAKVYGDFNRISRTAQNMEIILPYSGAIQAGARAIGRASRERPLETAFKDATLIAGIGAFAAYSLQNNADYFKDMVASGKEYELDANINIVLPGARRDADGNWSGVIKIPLTPDFRPYNRATWRSVYQAAAGQEIDPGVIAGSIFNQFTGDLATSVYDGTRVNQDNENNVVNGILSASPAGNTLKTLFGVNTRTGDSLTDDYLAAKPRTEQFTDYTSENAKGLSRLFGGVLTPLQIDQQLNSLGNVGDAIQNREDPDGGAGNPLAKLFDIKKSFRPGKSQTEEKRGNQDFMRTVNEIAGSIQDKKTYNQFMSYYSKGAENSPKNLLNTATKANQWMQYQDGAFTTTPLFAAEKALDAAQRAKGKPGNPIFDLAPQELQKVLNYRSSKIANSAKQNYTKDGEGMFQALGLDNKWYDNFKKAEEAYYDSQNLKTDDNQPTTFSGKKRPEVSPELEAVQNAYFAIPDDDKETRRAYLDAHPEIKDYWATSEGFTNEERQALGFNPIETYAEKQARYGRGGGGGGYSPQEYNILNRLSRLGGSLPELQLSIDRKEEPQLDTELRRLFARPASSVSEIRLGASSRGQG